MGVFKSIERFLRRKINDMFKRRDPVVRLDGSTSVLEGLERPRIVLLRQDRLGDTIITFPLLALLRKRLPQAHITLVIGDKNIGLKPVVSAWVDEVVHYTKSLGGALHVMNVLRSGRFDVIVDLLRDDSTTSNILVRFSGIPVAVGLNKPSSDVHTHLVYANEPDKHIVETTSAVALAFGIHPQADDLILRLPNLPQLQPEDVIAKTPDIVTIGLNIAAGTKARFWGVPKFVELIQKLYSEHSNIEVYVFADARYAQEQAEIVHNTPAHSGPSADSFVKYAAILGQVDMIISPDTSTAHLASAFSLPSVIMYLGKEAPKSQWVPWQSPCYDVYSKTGPFSGIEVHETLAAANQCLLDIQQGK